MKGGFSFSNEIPPTRMIVLWAGVLVVVFFLMLDSFVLSTHKKNTTLLQKIAEKKQALDIAKQALAQQNTPSSNLAPAEQERVNAIFEKVKTAFSKQNQNRDQSLSDLLSRLNSPAENRARLTAFNLVKQNHQDQWSAIQFKLRLSGSYEQILNYLFFLKSLPFLTRMDSFSLRSTNPTTPDALDFISIHTLYLKKSVLGQANEATEPLGNLSFHEASPSKTTEAPFAPFKRADSEKVSRPAAQGSEPKMKLTSIMTGQTRALALINEKICNVGDEIEGYTIVSITSREVTLKHPAGNRVLHIAEYLPEAAGSGPEAKDEKKPEIKKEEEKKEADETPPPAEQEKKEEENSDGNKEEKTNGEESHHTQQREANNEQALEGVGHADLKVA